MAAVLRRVSELPANAAVPATICAGAAASALRSTVSAAGSTYRRSTTICAAAVSTGRTAAAVSGAGTALSAAAAATCAAGAVSADAGANAVPADAPSDAIAANADSGKYHGIYAAGNAY